jgi:ABC-2 type transport system ATP-binding protein
VPVVRVATTGTPGVVGPDPSETVGRSSLNQDLAVRLEGVTKEFGTVRAVSELDLSIPRGSMYGLLGPNGSGKTTTIRMIMGILGPDRGEVSLLGGDPGRARRERVGYLPEERGLYRRMRVHEHLVFLARIRGVSRDRAFQGAARWLERMGLEEWRDRRVEDLSKGMQQKVQFIGTVLHDPELLILDEPFSGLDPINQDVLEEIVREFHRKGATILFSTHLMDQAERLCERVCLIARSRKVLDGDLRELKRAESRGVVAVDFQGPDDWIRGREVLRAERTGAGVRIQLQEGADPHPLLERAVASGARVTRFEVVEPRLHEIFVRHAGRAAAEGAGLPPEMARAAPPRPDPAPEGSGR